MPAGRITGQYMNKFLILMVAVASTALTACGGGGGGSAAVSPVAASTESFQLRTAYINSISLPRTLVGTLSGTVGGVTITGNGTQTQGSMTAGTFEGVAGLKSVTTLIATFKANGQTVPVSLSVTNHTDSNYVPMGWSGAQYQVVVGAVNIPISAKINDTALALTANRYTSSSKQSRVGTLELTYVLQPDTASTALLKLIETEKNTSGVMTSQTISTFRITPAGGITALSLSNVIPSDNTNLLVTY